MRTVQPPGPSLVISTFLWPGDWLGQRHVAEEHLPLPSSGPELGFSGKGGAERPNRSPEGGPEWCSEAIEISDLVEGQLPPAP